MAATIVTQQRCHNELASEQTNEIQQQLQKQHEPSETFQMDPAVVLTTAEGTVNANRDTNIEKSQQEDENGEQMMLSQKYDVEHLATFTLLPLTQSGVNDRGSSRSSETSNSSSCDETNSKSNGSSDSGCIIATTTESTPAPMNDNTRDHINNVEGLRQTKNGDKLNHDNDYIDGGRRQQQQQPIRASDLKASSAQDALERLFALEKLSGIWTQQMKLELTNHDPHQTDNEREETEEDDSSVESSARLVIIDCETNTRLESFEATQLQKVQAFKHYNNIYNNILLFIIRNFDKQSEEIHIFQCVSNEAEEISQIIEDWKKLNTQNQPMGQSKQQQQVASPKSTSSDVSANENLEITSSSDRVGGSSNSNNKPISPPAPPPLPQAMSATSKPAINVASSKYKGRPTGESAPLVNVNVKETVQVFNQIAAQREKSKSSSPVAGQQASASTSPVASRAQPNAKSSRDIGSSDNDKQQQHQQFFKQRSIRATLAPDMQSQRKSDNSTSSNNNKPLIDNHQHQHHGSSSSTRSSSMNSAAAFPDNPNDIGKRQSVHSDASVTGSSSSSSDATINNNSVNQLPTSSSISSPSNNHNQHHHHHQNHAIKPSNSRAAGDMQPALANPNQSKVGIKATSHHHHRSQNITNLQARRSSPEQVATNESYVSVLNHCFDDIEKFILRLQQSVTAHRELQAKKKMARRAGNQTSQSSSSRNHSSSRTSSATLAVASSASNGSTSTTAVATPNNNHNVAPPLITNVELAMLAAKARGPNEEDYFEILSKFKLAFNLLAKLKGCIHDPNAPELVHFLFTPLTIIIESARNASPQIDPTLVGIPYLNQDALDLLSNCCTSKESDMWLSLGPNWTQTIDLNLLKVSRLPSSFQPVFSDGWAPVIGELELIGLVLPPNAMPAQLQPQAALSTTSSSSSSSSPNKTASKHHNKLQRQQISPTSESAKLTSGVKFSSKSRSQHYLNDPNMDAMQNGSAIRKRNGSTSQINEPMLQAATAAPLAPLRSDYQPAPLTAYNDPYEYNYRAGHYRTAMGEDDLPRVTKSQSSSSRSEASRAYQKPLGRRQGDMIEPFIHTDHPFEPTNDYLHEPIDGDNFVQQQQYKNDRRNRKFYLADGLDYNAIDQNDGLLPQSFPMRQSMVEHPQAANNYRAAGRHRQTGDVLLSPAYLVRRYTQTGDAQQDQVNNRRHEAHHRRQSAGAPSDLYADEPVNANGGYLDEADQEAMLLDLGPAQTEWFFELQSRGAMIVRVLFTREANNDKELTVRRGELLEILDNSRRWWRARNIELEIAYVPHTIVAPMQNYQSLDELLISNCEIADLPGQTGFLSPERHIQPHLNQQPQPQPQSQQDQSRHANRYLNQSAGQLQSRQQAMTPNVVRQPQQHQPQVVRNSVSGPFRYF